MVDRVCFITASTLPLSTAIHLGPSPHLTSPLRHPPFGAALMNGRAAKGHHGFERRRQGGPPKVHRDHKSHYPVSVSICHLLLSQVTVWCQNFIITPLCPCLSAYRLCVCILVYIHGI